MTMQVPPPTGPNGPNQPQEISNSQGLTPLGAVPPLLTSISVTASLNKFEKLMVALMAMVKEAKKYKPKSVE